MRFKNVPPFRSGDVVVCVDAFGARELNYGSEYVVKEVVNDEMTWFVRLVGVSERNRYWGRFERKVNDEIQERNA